MLGLYLYCLLFVSRKLDSALSPWLRSSTSVYRSQVLYSGSSTPSLIVTSHLVHGVKGVQSKAIKLLLLFASESVPPPPIPPIPPIHDIARKTYGKGLSTLKPTLLPTSVGAASTAPGSSTAPPAAPSLVHATSPNPASSKGLEPTASIKKSAVERAPLSTISTNTSRTRPSRASKTPKPAPTT